MAVGFDATSDAEFSGTNISSFTDNSFTIGTGSNRAMVYGLNFGWSTYTQPTGISVVWDPTGANQPLSLIVQSPNTSGNVFAQLWGLVAPVSGNKSLAVSWASPVDLVKAAGVSFIDVDQTGGTTTFNNANTNFGTFANVVNLTVLTTANDAAVGDAVGTGPGNFASFGLQNIFHDTSGFMNAAASYEINGTTAAFNMSASGYNNWSSIGTNIKGHTITPVHTV